MSDKSADKSARMSVSVSVPWNSSYTVISGIRDCVSVCLAGGCPGVQAHPHGVLLGRPPSWSRDYFHFWSRIGSYILLAVNKSTAGVSM